MRDASDDLFSIPGASPMGALLKRHSEGTDLRITDQNGDPWFIAGDAAKLLGYDHTPHLTRLLEEDEKGVQTVDTPGGKQEMTIISETGLMRAISQRRITAGLDKDTADKIQRFQKWLFADVLPSIRRHGSYGAGATSGASAGRKDDIRAARSTFSDFHSIAKLIGLTGNQAAFAANRATVKLTGIDPLAIMDATHLTAETQEALLIPTEIGIKLGGISPRAVNQRLLALGYQIPSSNPKHSGWEPTEKGRPFGLWQDTSKRQGDGTPIRQWKWFSRIVDQLRAEPAMALVPHNNDRGDAS